MKILVVSHYVLPHIGGIEVLVEQLGQNFSRAGHEVTLLASNAGGRAEERRAGIRILRVRAWNFLERRWGIPYPLFSPRLAIVLRREVPYADVVHSHGVLYLGSLCALFWGWWYNRPVVVTEHVGMVPYRSRFLNGIQRIALALTARLFLRGADAAIVYNSRVQSWLSRLSAHPGHLHFVHNGIDIEKFHPASPGERQSARSQLRIDSARPLVLFVGRFVEKKGIEELLRLPAGAYDLLLCGRGELPRTAKRSDVHVLGEINHEHMPQVYRAADLFILPSRGEGFPVAIMEAMATGLPIIAARDETYDRYVTDAEILQTAGDETSLHAAVCRLLGDASERQRLGAAARRRAVADFSIGASVAAHLRIYEEVRGAHPLTG